MLTAAAASAKLKAHTPLGAMSEEQLSALLATLKEDAGFREKLQGAGDLDAVLILITEAGFSITMQELRDHWGQLSLSDYELELIAGGNVDCQLHGSLTNTQAAYCTSKQCPTKCDMPVC